MKIVSVLEVERYSIVKANLEKENNFCDAESVANCTDLTAKYILKKLHNFCKLSHLTLQCLRSVFHTDNYRKRSA
jgi:hypothetical protein